MFRQADIVLLNYFCENKQNFSEYVSYITKEKEDMYQTVFKKHIIVYY